MVSRVQGRFQLPFALWLASLSSAQPDQPNTAQPRHLWTDTKVSLSGQPSRIEPLPLFPLPGALPKHQPQPQALGQSPTLGIALGALDSSDHLGFTCPRALATYPHSHSDDQLPGVWSALQGMARRHLVSTFAFYSPPLLRLLCWLWGERCHGTHSWHSTMHTQSRGAGSHGELSEQRTEPAHTAASPPTSKQAAREAAVVSQKQPSTPLDAKGSQVGSTASFLPRLTRCPSLLPPETVILTKEWHGGLGPSLSFLKNFGEGQLPVSLLGYFWCSIFPYPKLKSSWGQRPSVQIPQDTCALSRQSCLTLCNPMDCSLSGSSAHRILQARIHLFKPQARVLVLSALTGRQQTTKRSCSRREGPSSPRLLWRTAPARTKAGWGWKLAAPDIILGPEEDWKNMFPQRIHLSSVSWRWRNSHITLRACNQSKQGACAFRVPQPPPHSLSLAPQST